MNTGLLFIIAAAFATSSSAMFGKLTTKYFTGNLTAFISQLLGGILLLPLFFIFSPTINWTLGSISILVSIGVLNALAYASYYKALKVDSASIIIALSSMQVIVSGAIGILFFGEDLSIQKILATFGVIASLFVLIVDFKELKKLSVQKTSLIYMVIASISWGSLFPLLKLSSNYMDSITPVVIGRFISAFLLYFLVRGSYKTIVENSKRPNVKLIILFLAFFNALSFVLYTVGVKNIDISIAHPIYGSHPIILALLASVFFKEKLNMQKWLGIIFTVLSVVLLKLS